MPEPALRGGREAGRTTQATFLQNAGTDTAWFHSFAAAAHLCLTKGRISFERADGPRVSNRYGQVFFYLGERGERFGPQNPSRPRIFRLFPYGL